MVTAVGAVAVVSATGYDVVLVGSRQVAPEEQTGVGALALVTDVVLPVVTKVPESGSAAVPVVNVVAEAVTCQPAPDPVASSTRYDWWAVVVSTSDWLRPFSVPDQASAVGEVRVSGPASRLSVPVRVQDVPAAIAVPQGPASAVLAVSRTGA